jgi:hypothetical protein
MSCSALHLWVKAHFLEEAKTNCRFQPHCRSSPVEPACWASWVGDARDEWRNWLRDRRLSHGKYKSGPSVPLFILADVTGLGALGLLGWRRKQKAKAA